jgi:predicted ATPase
MGVHSGEATTTGDDYVGLALHQVARITNAGHGGQVLVSEASRRVATSLPEGLSLRDLGERRLKDLASPERLYQLVGDGLADKFPPLRTLDTKANNLPVQVTSFVGRDELDAALATFNGTRLLTLTGPGGTGKTRLALQLAAEASDDFPDGVYFVALDSTRDASLVPAVIASTLGVAIPGGAEPLDALIDHLRDKRTVLVLDNFEQIVDAGTDVARIVREAPQVKVIITTRIPLRVYGEQEFPVPPLDLPPASGTTVSADEAAAYEAVRLFAERAMAVQPSFALTDDNAPSVVEIVQRLDGLPLAIELAAARTRVLPVSAIRSRLGQHLSLLTGGARDLPERQQTLRGAIDWSYELLEEPDRRLFERFSVHAGGAYLTEADLVCGPPDELGEDVLDGLSSLAEKSLVKAGLDGGEDPRFAMLATIRDYAHELLDASAERETLNRRHANAYLGLVEGLAPDIIGLDAARVNDRLEADNDNLRAALDWAVEQGETEYALRFVAAVWRFWQTRGHLAEARGRIERVFAMPGIDEQAATLMADAYEAAGGVTYWQGDVPATHDFYARGLAAARASGDRLRIARALYNFGFAPLEELGTNAEMYVASKPYTLEALEIFKELGDEKGIADSAWALAIADSTTDETRASAITYAEEALMRYRRLGEPFGTGWGAFMVGNLLTGSDSLDAAEPYLREALEIFAGARDRSGVLLCLGTFAFLAARRGDTERFDRLAGVLERLRAETGAGIVDSIPDFVKVVLPTKPTEGDRLATWEQGGRMTEEEAVSYALGGPSEGTSGG